MYVEDARCSEKRVLWIAVKGYASLTAKRELWHFGQAFCPSVPQKNRLCWRETRTGNRISGYNSNCLIQYLYTSAYLPVDPTYILLSDFFVIFVYKGLYNKIQRHTAWIFLVLQSSIKAWPMRLRDV